MVREREDVVNHEELGDFGDEAIDGYPEIDGNAQVVSVAHVVMI